ncbi:unnamed protein product [Prorocentrum cordatum]|uniref:Uncharacterized protein n=1 Tax=Prorocentrum cordatum TaxID=2364126 RepID=A0ABN9WJK1_9DINO|nr:unnamed protein product [Polarella glacialis]
MEAWAYGATGSYVPEGLNKAQSGWAALTSWALLWPTRSAEEFGAMMRTRRFWPTNLPKKLRRLPEDYFKCWHPPTLASAGANSRGRWITRAGCTTRVSHVEMKSMKGTPKEKRMCLCKKKDAARLLRGQGRAQHGGEATWQAIILVPKPPPGADRSLLPVHPGMRAHANRSKIEGSSSYTTVADPAAAAASGLQRDETFLRDVKTAAQQTAQRRAESAKRKVAKDDGDKMEAEPPAQNDLATQAKMEQEMQAKFDKQFEDMMAMLQVVAANQQSQGEALAKVNSTASEQMRALATIRGEAQEASRPGPELAGASRSHSGTAPLDPTKLPPAMARDIQEQKTSRMGGAPAPSAAPSLGRYPTYPTADARQQLNPQELYDEQGKAIQDSMEAVSSFEIPPTDPLATAYDQRKGKAKGSAASLQAADAAAQREARTLGDTWTGGQPTVPTQTPNHEKDWHSAGWRTYDGQGKWR